MFGIGVMELIVLAVLVGGPLSVVLVILFVMRKGRAKE
jgi:hypothetical protein